MKAFTRIVKQGNSLMVAVTKPARLMDLHEGDWIKISIEVPKPEDFTAMPTSYDPTEVGNLVLEKLGVTKSEDNSLSGFVYQSEDHIMSIIKTYEKDPKKAQMVLQYINEYWRNRA